MYTADQITTAAIKIGLTNTDIEFLLCALEELYPNSKLAGAFGAAHVVSAHELNDALTEIKSEAGLVISDDVRINNQSYVMPYDLEKIATVNPLYNEPKNFINGKKLPRKKNKKR